MGFVISHRLRGQHAVGADHGRLLLDVLRRVRPDLLDRVRTGPNGRLWLNVSAGDADALRAHVEAAGHLLEPVLPRRHPQRPAPPATDAGTTVKRPTVHTLTIVGSDGGTPRGTVTGTVAREGAGASAVGTVAADGHVVLPLKKGDRLVAVELEPTGGYYRSFWRAPAAGATLTATALPTDGPIGWWHRAVGAFTYDPAAGRGIRIGIVDSGLGPNATLAHVVSLGSYLQGRYNPHGGADVSGHGTFVAGLIGARPIAAGQFGGVAPAAEIYVLRVYPSATGSASQTDIAAAIGILAESCGCHLINLSLEAKEPSTIEHDAIAHAWDTGTLCIVSAGNDGADQVYWPAVYAETVCVAAVGADGLTPPDTIGSTYGPRPGAEADGLYVPAFSNAAPQVTCTAPGVSLVGPAPDPTGGAAYTSDTGTSMAAPMVTGALARRLATQTGYLGLPRTAARSAAALQALTASPLPVALPPTLVGRGVPQA